MKPCNPLLHGNLYNEKVGPGRFLFLFSFFFSTSSKKWSFLKTLDFEKFKFKHVWIRKIFVYLINVQILKTIENKKRNKKKIVYLLLLGRGPEHGGWRVQYRTGTTLVSALLPLTWSAARGYRYSCVPAAAIWAAAQDQVVSFAPSSFL
jgi:hypothetical protein